MRPDTRYEGAAGAAAATVLGPRVTSAVAAVGTASVAAAVRLRVAGVAVAMRLQVAGVETAERMRVGVTTVVRVRVGVTTAGTATVDSTPDSSGLEGDDVGFVCILPGDGVGEGSNRVGAPKRIRKEGRVGEAEFSRAKEGNWLGRRVANDNGGDGDHI